MPRIYTSQSDPLDFHKRCFPSYKAAWTKYGFLGDGPDDRGNCFGYDTGSPDYDDGDCSCAKCGRTLTARDH